MLAMALHCVSAKSVFHKDCSCSCDESSCIRMKFTCIASLLVRETGPINDTPTAASRQLAVCFTFADLLYAKGLRNVSTN